VVFKLSELGELYQKRLEQKGIQSGVIKTRLKEKLLAEISELEAHKSGREVLLAFKKDIGPVLSSASSYTDALLLGKAAKILWKDMINHKFTFDGHFNEATVDKAVPSISC
jgi:hypothetical protein